jgi:osmotically inducible protein OsmC
MKKNTANAIWIGSLKEGNGILNVKSVNQELPYTFSSRFSDGKGANPEELIAAAHAGCFSMALSALLTEKGYKVKSISTEAEIVLEKHENGFQIVESNLTTKAEVPEMDEDLFTTLAVNAKVNCPVSQALSSVKITIRGQLV